MVMIATPKTVGVPTCLHAVRIVWRRSSGSTRPSWCCRWAKANDVLRYDHGTVHDKTEVHRAQTHQVS